MIITLSTQICLFTAHNMPRKNFRINSVLGGWSNSQYLYKEGQYLSSIAVDPDMPISDSDTRTSGLLVPVQYEKFSSTNISGYPKWIITSNKNTLVYVYNSDGKFVSYTNTLGSETLVGTPTSGAGNGAAYYNNYIYLATPTNISRYGPLDNSPSLTNTVWTGSTLGTQTALTDTTYPTLQGVSIPNHPLYTHTNNICYIGDVLPSANTTPGRGCIHSIATKKTTDQGDTNNSSLYNALDLPIGFFPTAMVSYGTDLMISAIQTTDTVINQGKAAIFIWDTISDSFYRGPIYLQDPIVTALQNVNGTVYIYTGNTVNGWRISYYAGGDTVTEVQYFEEGTPPLQGAVDSFGSRVSFGASTTNPATSASVFSLGSKNAHLPSGLHNIAKSTASGGTPTVTALKYIQQSSNAVPKMLIGWGTGAAYGIDKYSTSQTLVSIWRSQVVNVGTKFNFVELRIPFAAALASNMTLTVTIYTDDGSATSALTAITLANFPVVNGVTPRKVRFKEAELQQITGQNNFYIQLAWTGTVKLPVALPIEVVIDTYDDEPRGA